MLIFHADTALNKVWCGRSSYPALTHRPTGFSSRKKLRFLYSPVILGIDLGMRDNKLEIRIHLYFGIEKVISISLNVVSVVSSRSQKLVFRYYFGFYNSSNEHLF